MNPRVSVVMPAHDCARYLRKSIESVLTQTFTDFEFLIVTDSLAAKEDISIIDSYSDPRIIHLWNETRPGFVASRNFGIRSARGEYVATMDADDISMPERLEKQVRCLDHNPDIGILGTAFETIDDHDRVISREMPPCDPEVTPWFLMFGCPIAHSSTMIRRRLIETLGGYTELAHGEDYDLWLRASQITNIANLPDILIKRRIHRGSLTERYYQVPRSEQAARVHANAISLISGVNVSTGIALAMSEYKVRTAERAPQAALMLRQLYLQFISRRQLKEQSKAIVRSDLTLRLRKLWLVCALQNPLTSLKIWFTLAQLSPAASLSAVFLALRTGVRKAWTFFTTE
jgi:glycosyltransferase involved in cell wall biosynthesis